MHSDALDQWQHPHNFQKPHRQSEKRTLYVLILTAVTMVIEIIAGSHYGSMALLADGWHMGTHVAAFMITLFAYRYARIHANDPAYAFGTGKVGVLGGFASAVSLAVVAVMMISESLQRFFSPHDISFNEAIMVATLGLLVNIISAYLLVDHHHHDHSQKSEHVDEQPQAEDHNLRAAYYHVLADAFTSLLAITALLTGKYFNWLWMDPVMGVVGAIIIIKWAINLTAQTAPILLDGSITLEDKASICKAIERHDDNRVVDCHIWKVSDSDYAVILSLVTHQPKSPEHYKSLLGEFTCLSHITIEVNQCHDKTK